MKKTDPLRELLAIQQQINKLFEDRLARAGITLDNAAPGSGWVPPVDLYETEVAVVLKAELPGFRAGDLEVEFDGQAIVLRGERKKAAGSRVPSNAFHRMEREYGPFMRTFTLASPMPKVPVRTSYRDGVLEVTLEKPSPKG